MRKLAIFLILVFGSTCWAIKLEPNCVFQMKMNDDTNSTTVLDSSGNDYHGTAQQNTEDINAVGQINGALDFRKSAYDYIDADNPHTLTLRDDCSFSLWFRVRDGQPESTQILCGIYDYDDEFLIFIYSTGSVRSLYYASYGQINLFSTAFLLDGQNDWCHVVVTYENIDGVKARGKLYINSVLIADSGAQNEVYMPEWSSTDLNLFIGASNNMGEADDYFDGLIDDVRIYNKALSQSEITALYNNGHGTERLNFLSRPRINGFNKGLIK